MKVLLTGANGFLGYYLTGQLLERGHQVIATGRGECRLPFRDHPSFFYESMDFTDPFAADTVFEKYDPGVVVHAGAMSKVDECELNQSKAYLDNVTGTVNMLQHAKKHTCFFVFVSTDFIFSGEKNIYYEDDLPGPVNFYGRTKAEAEKKVKEYDNEWAIVRTILVYGKPVTGKPNLLTVVKEKLEKGEEYRVVDDQLRTPTYVEDLAAGIVSVVEKKATGIYHVSGRDQLTPYQMACRVADHLHLDKSLIRKVTAKEFSQPAKRPPHTIFDIDRAVNILGLNPVTFEAGLQKTFA